MNLDAPVEILRPCSRSAPGLFLGHAAPAKISRIHIDNPKLFTKPAIMRPCATHRTARNCNLPHLIDFKQLFTCSKNEQRKKTPYGMQPYRNNPQFSPQSYPQILWVNENTFLQPRISRQNGGRTCISCKNIHDYGTRVLNSDLTHRSASVNSSYYRQRRKMKRIYNSIAHLFRRIAGSAASALIALPEGFQNLAAGMH